MSGMMSAARLLSTVVLGGSAASPTTMSHITRNLDSGITLSHDGHDGHDGEALGTYFARCAELEALSVYAFERLARELRALGAPEGYSERAEQAAMEEVRHASTMANLAARFGTTPPTLQMGALPLRPLFDVALENAVEGVVRETFSAAIALHTSVHAEDPEVRAAHVAIAEEERAHAELTVELDAWFATRLDAAQRMHIERAKADALEALIDELDAVPPSSPRASNSLPPATQALAILDGLFGALSSASSGRSLMTA